MEKRDEMTTAWKATHPGSIVKYELEERQITQREFAKMIGMQVSHVSELLKGKRTMTKAVADKIESVLGLSAITLVNMQTKYEYDLSAIEKRGVEECEAQNTLANYDEAIDIKTIFKRFDVNAVSAIKRLKFLYEECLLPKPAELQLEVAGMFKKPSSTGLDSRMLMTWKVIAETTARKLNASGQFDVDNMKNVVGELTKTLHDNHDTENAVNSILSKNGIVFCIVPKLDRASIDGYSFVENGKPYIILTKRYDRIDNFAFSLMHEVGHICLQHHNNADYRLSITDYDNDSAEEREANSFAADALIPNSVWRNAPKVKMNPLTIQREYSHWAESKNMNKWIVLGRIAYETGMYKFRADGERKIG